MENKLPTSEPSPSSPTTPARARRLLSVTHLTSYIYCPRKFYLEKIKGLRQPPTKPMIEGRIRHDIRQAFSNNEKDFILTLTKEVDIENNFKRLLSELIHTTFLTNSKIIKTFSISPTELNSKITQAMQKEIQPRAQAIKTTIEQGHIGPELWLNLKPKYISELSLQSEKIGIRGRVDRVMIQGDKIIPFELKTREIQKIYPSDEIQLTCYAMLLEEHYNKPIPLGILEAGNTTHELPITQENKDKVVELVQEVNNITENPPFPSSFSKCQSCSLKAKCEKLGEKQEEF